MALNDATMIFAIAPVAGLLLGISSITVPWAMLLTSVMLCIVIPVLLAQAMRRRLLSRGQPAFDAALARMQPWSVAALLATLVLLVAFQGNAIVEQPLVIALLAVPILIQVFFNSSVAYLLNRAVGVLIEVPAMLLVVRGSTPPEAGTRPGSGVDRRRESPARRTMKWTPFCTC